MTHSPVLVAHVLQSWPQAGGVARVVTELIDAGNAMGVPSVLCAPPPLSRSLAGFTPSLVASHDRVWLAVRPHLQSLQAVVLHGVFTPACARIAFRLRRAAPHIKIIAFPHDSYDAGLFATRHLAKRLYWQVIEGRYLSKADAVVSVSGYQARVLASRGIRTSSVLAPLGMSQATRERAEALLLNRESIARAEKLRLLFVGRWDISEKGLDLLFDALRSDSWLRAHVSLRIVGPEVGSRDDVERLAVGCGDVDLVGWTDNVDAELAAAQAYVQPSRKEGFGLAALDALASGLPALISAVSGLADYVSLADGALAVEPSVPSIRAGLERLVVEHITLAAAARTFGATGSQRFRWDALAEKIFAAAGIPVAQ